MGKWFKRCIILAILMLSWSLIETQIVRVKHYEYNQPGLKGLTIVFLSDFHYSNTTSKNKVRRIVKKTNQLNPDIVILGGDYTNDDATYVEEIFDELSHIQAKIGVYVISGNHDYSLDNEDTISHMTDHYGMVDLNNTSYWIDYEQTKFKLGGIADMTHIEPEPEKTIHDTTPMDFVILASHQPDYIKNMDERTSGLIDLMLSGHTHGGQITLWGLHAPYIPSEYKQKFRTGRVTVKDTDLIISNGLGESILPLRFFSTSQIVVVDFI